MSQAQEIVSQIFDAADGEIVGRIRLQKIVYLLEQMGLESRMQFTYHHYGPFCREFAQALDRDLMEKNIEESEQYTDYGTSYSIFRAQCRHGADRVGRLPIDQARSTIKHLKRVPSVILEIAATIHWLREKEQLRDWRAELKVRKTRKASDRNIEQAMALLTQLGLSRA